MHVLIIPSWYPTFPGDVHGSFFRDQALALHKYGQRVGVIYVQLRSPKALKENIQGPHGIIVENDNGVQMLKHVGLDWFPRMAELHRWLWLRRGMDLFKRYISEHGRPDVLHGHAMLNGGVLANAISGQYGIPFVVTEHGSAYSRGSLSLKQLDLARTVAETAARRLAVSANLCNLLQQILAPSNLRWEEMPNIVAQEFVDSELPSQNNVTEPFTFLNVALLTEVKAVDNLIISFVRAFRADSGVVLKIGGDGPERPRLEALAEDLGVANRVLFLGKLSRDQVLKEISKTNAFVLSSRYETFGVVVIEALAMGKPVIATRCGGPESIVQERDGLLVPIDDVPALATAMTKMRARRARYNAVEIRDACIARYGNMAVAARLSTIYSEVLAASNGRTD